LICFCRLLFLYKWVAFHLLNSRILNYFCGIDIFLSGTALDQKTAWFIILCHWLLWHFEFNFHLFVIGNGLLSSYRLPLFVDILLILGGYSLKLPTEEIICILYLTCEIGGLNLIIFFVQRLLGSWITHSILAGSR
jgi:hypothetical protein